MNTNRTTTPTDTYISSIELENWRQYKDTQTIELEPDGGQHINAIIGENGTGKTNLSKAVSTCLNGTVPGESNDNGEDEPHVNAEVFEQTDEGESVSGSIVLNLSHKGTEYEIVREFESRNEDGVCVNEIDSNLTVRRFEPSSGWEKIDNPSRELKSILPPEVQQYYFFDGERLNGLFQEGDYEDDVRKAVWELSHIDVLENSIDHLGTLRDERRRKAKNTSGEVKEAREDRDETEAERFDLIHQKATVEQSIESKETTLAEIEDRMGAAENPEVLALFQQRAKLEGDIERLCDKEDELSEELDRLLIEAGSICLAADALDIAANQFEEMDARDELPPAVRRQFLTGLLDDDECLCGCDLNKHPTRRQTVEEFRDSPPAIDDRLIKASYEFPDTRANGLENFQELIETKRSLRDTTAERLGKESDAEELTQQLRDYDLPEDVDLKALDEQREQLRDELRGLHSQQGRLEEKVESVEAQIDNINDRIDRELRKDERSKELIQEVEWYKQALQELQGIKNDLMTEVKDSISERLDEYYNGLTWKDEDYDLRVEDDFSIRIDGPDGRRQVSRLSAGETQLLALSFIASLTEVSGFEAPVLIDTPVGRIDQDHRSAIGEKIPEYLAEHQLTFLFTDSEFDDTMSTELDEHLANTYKLENDNRVTDVEDY